MFKCVARAREWSSPLFSFEVLSLLAGKIGFSLGSASLYWSERD